MQLERVQKNQKSKEEQKESKQREKETKEKVFVGLCPGPALGSPRSSTDYFQGLLGHRRAPPLPPPLSTMERHLIVY